MKRATIVITSYNRPTLLPRAVDSAINQTWPNTEIIIADDNSPNSEVWDYIGTLPLGENLIAFNSRVSNETRGLTARYATQINHAIDIYSTGDYLFFLPDDDLFDSNKLEQHIEFMESYNASVTYGTQIITNEDGAVIGTRVADEVLESAFNVVDHSQVCMTRGVHDAVNGWPDNDGYWSGADAYMWDRVREAGFKFYPVAEAICTKQMGNGVQSRVFSGLQPWDDNNS